MLALFILPALIGLALLIDTNSDDDDTVDTPDVPETPDTETTQLTDGIPDFLGTSSPEHVIGTDGDNLIDGQGGNDFIEGKDGDDSIDGGSGSDRIFAGDGDDAVLGGEGNDRVFLGDGDDSYIGTESDNEGEGNDFIRGGSGKDLILDQSGSDTIFGDVGNDSIGAFGEDDEADTLNGGYGSDTIVGDNGDLMIGGQGNDLFSVIKADNTTPENVTVDDFNTDDDTFQLLVNAPQESEAVNFGYDEAKGGVTASWRGEEVAILKGLTEADIPNINTSIRDLDGVESGTSIFDLVAQQTETTQLTDDTPDFLGTSSSEHVIGSDGANLIEGQGGNDFIEGKGGADRIDGGNGSDRIFAGGGNDAVIGGEGNDRVFLGDGNDAYIGTAENGAGNDFIRGGSGKDLILDQSGSDTIFGDVGNDSIGAFGEDDEADTLNGGYGSDTIVGDNGDLMIGGQGNDLFSVIKENGTTPDSVTVDDFNTNEDTFQLLVGDANEGEAIDFSYNETEGGVSATWRGEEVAFLKGLTEADIPNIATSVVDVEDLEDGASVFDINPQLPEPEEQIVSDGYIGTDASELLRVDEEGGDVNAGRGADTIYGSDQDDILRGGRGDDSILSGAGDDSVAGGTGNDFITMGDGDDVSPLAYSHGAEANANAGDDTISGGSGDDVIVDRQGSNKLNGGLHHDHLEALDGPTEDLSGNNPVQIGTVDTLNGGYGNDTLVGDAGDIMTGGEGDDQFYVADYQDVDVEEVRITDFVTDEDTLTILHRGESEDSEPVLEVTPEGVTVSYDGKAVAVLEGLTESDLPNIEVAITRLSDQEAA
ncbi:Ca2+-binding RTX toxin-like protein [Sulfitobacter undariae]|uniref:Ca2+-binding RTX toxin-like protein n=1 Tax=Sulfitobacter undariae TaxID=1563671 RepID=A0A7W6E316_9RHOB|nr:calcium-binding protein [Sulfitobacter undariae]MBB3992546.1 Ca2+-binding RTX toxin-like protein [Sulfitobacter undariae]